MNFDEKLGRGAFGDVYVGRIVGDAGIRRVYPDVLMLGRLKKILFGIHGDEFLNKGILAKFHDCKVAVKTLSAYADKLCKSEFQQATQFVLIFDN